MWSRLATMDLQTVKSRRPTGSCGSSRFLTLTGGGLDRSFFEIGGEAFVFDATEIRSYRNYDQIAGRSADESPEKSLNQADLLSGTYSQHRLRHRHEDARQQSAKGHQNRLKFFSDDNPSPFNFDLINRDAAPPQEQFNLTRVVRLPARASITFFAPPGAAEQAPVALRTELSEEGSRHLAAGTADELRILRASLQILQDVATS